MQAYRSAAILRPAYTRAGVAKSADARDLKSLGAYAPCGFKSHPRHMARLISLVGLACLWPTAAFAQADLCPPTDDRAGSVTVAVVIPEPVWEYRYGRDQLTARFGSHLGASERIEGYAEIPDAMIQWQWSSIESRWSDDPGGTGCVAVHVDVEFVFRAPVVLYVASEHREGSSCYDAVSRHEAEHYDVTMDLVESFGRRLQPALENDPNIATVHRPVRYQSAAGRQAVLDAILKRIEKIITGYTRRLNDDMKKANERLDRPSSYRRVFEDCTD